MKKKKSVLFIILVAVFATFWLASLLFLGFATFSDTITGAIEQAYSNVFKEKTMSLLSVTLWSTTIFTAALLITLLWDEIKRKYLK